MCIAYACHMHIHNAWIETCAFTTDWSEVFWRNAEHHTFGCRGRCAEEMANRLGHVERFPGTTGSRPVDHRRSVQGEAGNNSRPTTQDMHHDITSLKSSTMAMLKPKARSIAAKPLDLKGKVLQTLTTEKEVWVVGLLAKLVKDLVGELGGASIFTHEYLVT